MAVRRSGGFLGVDMLSHVLDCSSLLSQQLRCHALLINVKFAFRLAARPYGFFVVIVDTVLLS